MEETIIEIIISEGQNEVADFKKWGVDIIPHRVRMKQGFEVGDKRVDVESAFKNPDHPFRVAVVCAMWLNRLRCGVPFQSASGKQSSHGNAATHI